MFIEWKLHKDSAQSVPLFRMCAIPEAWRSKDISCKLDQLIRKEQSSYTGRLVYMLWQINHSVILWIMVHTNCHINWPAHTTQRLWQLHLRKHNKYGTLLNKNSLGPFIEVFLGQCHGFCELETCEGHTLSTPCRCHWERSLRSIWLYVCFSSWKELLQIYR